MTFQAGKTWACVAAWAAMSMAAQAEDATPRLSIELNTTQQVEQGCKLSFLVTNSHMQDVSKAVFETVLFDASGQVMRLTLFDFGGLPSGRPRVRQFVMPGASCEGIGQELFNGVHACDGAGPEACSKDLKLTTRTKVGVTG